MINGNITSKAWKNTYKKYSWWKEEMVKEVMTPKTHVMAELKKYAVFTLSYLDKALELHFKTHLGNGVSRPTFTSKRLLTKFFRGFTDA
jgi:hypothetical protein